VAEAVASYRGWIGAILKSRGGSRRKRTSATLLVLPYVFELNFARSVSTKLQQQLHKLQSFRVCAKAPAKQGSYSLNQQSLRTEEADSDGSEAREILAATMLRLTTREAITQSK
jgi:hypothetical protein